MSKAVTTTGGSIVFRNEDQGSLPRLYVNHLGKGAILAAKYRDCAVHVDVISGQDELVCSWVDGIPADNDSVAPELTRSILPYQPPDDVYGDNGALHQRIHDIGEMLEWGFNLAVGGGIVNHDPYELRSHEEADPALYQIELEARLIRQQGKKADHAERAQGIVAWLADTDRAFLNHRAEFMALGMLLGNFGAYDHIHDLEQELARIDAVWGLETRNKRLI